jgi:hypothetical protein
MDYFYDGQVKRYLTQFMRLMSNFSYKDAKGQLVEIPVRYGDMTRQVASILQKNSENIVQSAPFIACYIKDLQHDRGRMQDPTFVSKMNIRERELDENGYTRNQGSGYTVERLMPTPYTVTFAADLWTTNTDQKLQLWEQITVFFNPSLELQSTDSYIDWTSLSVVELTSQTFETRSIPQGLENEISICNLQFTCPIWISPPAKIKKLGIITKIISNVFVSDAIGSVVGKNAYKDISLAELFTGEIASGKTVVTPGNFGLVVLNNSASLVPVKESPGITDEVSLSNIQGKTNWFSVLDLYPGQFKAGLSQIRLLKQNNTEIVAYISLNPLDDFSMSLNFDAETVPGNTIIDGRGTVDAIIDPQKYNPSSKVAGTRYLILDDINPDKLNDPNYNGPNAWKNVDLTDFQASGNDIIEWDGTEWKVIFDSNTRQTPTYITNAYTGIQYKWEATNSIWQWSKSYEGVYDPGTWRLVL